MKQYVSHGSLSESSIILVIKGPDKLSQIYFHDTHYTSLKSLIK